MIDPEDPVVRRKNLVLAWSLFALFLLLFAGTVGVAFVYLALD
jgi:hypothetical protein